MKIYSLFLQYKCFWDFHLLINIKIIKKNQNIINIKIKIVIMPLINMKVTMWGLWCFMDIIFIFTIIMKIGIILVIYRYCQTGKTFKYNNFWLVEIQKVREVFRSLFPLLKAIYLENELWSCLCGARHENVLAPPRGDMKIALVKCQEWEVDAHSNRCGDTTHCLFILHT
jgi:hypothetical protein